MMTKTSTFKKQCIRATFLLICAGVVLLIGLLAFSKDTSGAEGTPLSIGGVVSYKPDGLFTFTFTAEKSFTVPYDLSGGNCRQQPIVGVQKFYFYVDDFTDSDFGFLINKDNLTIFADAGTCAVSESYTAGIEYTGYLVDGGHLIAVADSVATIKADKLKDLDENLDIDAESVFLSAQEDGGVGTQYTHDFFLTYPPTINIITPVDDSEMTGTFDITASYLNSGTYEKLMITFEEWDASSTCPVYGTDEWDDEVALGYFHYQSLPYFSPLILTDDGTTTVSIYDLNAGTYNCFKCYFVSESTGEMSGALCPDYNLSITTYIPPEYVPSFYVPITGWTSYYASSSERWATSTAVFDNWATAFKPIMVWVGQTALFFQDYFDADVAKAKGEDIGNAIATARGYLESIDDFFGGLPLSSIFIFYIITALVVIIYRIVRGILNIIVP